MKTYLFKYVFKFMRMFIHVFIKLMRMFIHVFIRKLVFFVLFLCFLMLPNLSIVSQELWEAYAARSLCLLENTVFFSRHVHPWRATWSLPQLDS